MGLLRADSNRGTWAPQGLAGTEGRGHPKGWQGQRDMGLCAAGSLTALDGWQNGGSQPELLRIDPAGPFLRPQLLRPSCGECPTGPPLPQVSSIPQCQTAPLDWERQEDRPLAGCLQGLAWASSQSRGLISICNRMDWSSKYRRWRGKRAVRKEMETPTLGQLTLREPLL